MNLPIFNWSIKTKKFSHGSMQIHCSSCVELEWRGSTKDFKPFSRLTKASNRPQEAKQSILPRGMRKVHNRTREQQSELREEAGAAGSADTFAFLYKLPPDPAPSRPPSPLLGGLSRAAEHKRTDCEAAREAGSLKESAVAWGRGSPLSPAVPSATKAFPHRVLFERRVEGWNLSDPFSETQPEPRSSSSHEAK